MASAAAAGSLARTASRISRWPRCEAIRDSGVSCESLRTPVVHELDQGDQRGEQRVLARLWPGSGEIGCRVPATSPAAGPCPACQDVLHLQDVGAGGPQRRETGDLRFDQRAQLRDVGERPVDLARGRPAPRRDRRPGAAAEGPRCHGPGAARSGACPPVGAAPRAVTSATPRATRPGSARPGAGRRGPGRPWRSVARGGRRARRLTLRGLLRIGGTFATPMPVLSTRRSLSVQRCNSPFSAADPAERRSCPCGEVRSFGSGSARP